MVSIMTLSHSPASVSPSERGCQLSLTLSDQEVGVAESASPTRGCFTNTKPSPCLLPRWIQSYPWAAGMTPPEDRSTGACWGCWWGGGAASTQRQRLAGKELTVLCFIIFSCFGGDSIVWASGCMCGGGIVVEGGGGPRDLRFVKGT